MRTRLSRRGFLSTGAAALVPALLPGAAEKLKIVSVKTWPVPLAPTGRFGTARFTSDFDPARWRWFGPFSQISGSIIVEVRTDQGITGYGFGGGGGASAYIIEHHLRDLLIGVNPLNIEMLWDQIHSSTEFYGRRGLAIMALSGIDNALWDIAGKQAGLPVYRLLGGTTKEKIPAYFTSNNVERGLELGFRAFKLPIADGVPQGREGMQRTILRVAEVRRRIGSDADLMIDCLGRWNVPYTIEIAARMAEYRLRWIEEPLYPDNIQGYEQLCREIHSTRIASGEHEYTAYGFSDLIRHNAVQVLQPDISWCGGLTALRRIVTLGTAHSLPIIPHRGSSRYAIHMIAASPACDLAESFGIGEPANEVLAALTSRFENGFVYPPTGPGFGVELNEAILRRNSRDAP
ncbi:MAG TPA: enolase C-terminal domain-like protein [Bryobacteraceae bacterium]|nr:enolase C-terminal domain-like protein [Bryobacteraceae bacterium]